MWHESRRRQKATQKLFAEQKRRAEKRREEDRVDPNSLLQVHGLKIKPYIDSNVYRQAQKSLVAWQGDTSVTIDRFDIRATLTSIPTDADDRRAKRLRSMQATAGSAGQQPLPILAATVLDADESETTKRLLSFERYRLLMQNELRQVPEETRLKLVAKSEYLTDARLKKLKHDRFGTSGESSSKAQIAPEQQYSIYNRRGSQLSNSGQRSRGGATISFGYNQVAPPLLPTSAEQDQQLEESSQVCEELDMLKRVIDLDEFDASSFDLDAVEKSRLDPKSTQEITERYGLSSSVFNFLAENCDKSTNISEISKHLEQFEQVKLEKEPAESSCSSSEVSLQQQKVPSTSSNTNTPPPEPNKTSNQPASGAALNEETTNRSYTGTADIKQSSSLYLKSQQPTREASLAASLSSSSQIACKQECGGPSQSSPPARARLSLTTTAAASRAIGNHRDATPYSSSPSASLPPQAVANHVIGGERQQQETKGLLGELNSSNELLSKQDATSDDVLQPRRAATPLAYKRHCRSSRSLSRDRRHGHERVRQSRSRRRSSSRRSTPSSFASGSYSDRRGSSLYSSRGSYFSGSRSRTRSRSRSSTLTSCTSSSSLTLPSRNHHQNHRPKSRPPRRRRRRGRAHSPSPVRRAPRVANPQPLPLPRPRRRRGGRKKSKRGRRRQR